jgi:mono/diheme cytochrome c family protein
MPIEMWTGMQTTNRTTTRLKKIALWTGGLVGLAIAGLAVAVAARQNRTFDAPAVAAHASKDPAVIERGRYLAFGAAHCGECHGAADRRAELAAGKEIPLSGGLEMKLPVGIFRPANITPDAETGIGRYTDGQLARMLRHGVRPDGRAVLPFMAFADMAEDDMDAILSFLRAQAPVRNTVVTSEPNMLGRVVKAFVLEPKGPTMPLRTSVAPAETADYGRYLAHSVANCVGCHTKADLRTGEKIGPLFGGGTEIDGFVTPNLTPDPRWGWIASWPEEVFVARIHMGRQRAGSPMPWDSFRKMNDRDLRAIYRYLRTLAPAQTGPDPSKPESVLLAAK